jgi:EmrB/QacA subfamily drug resistance transporter
MFAAGLVVFTAASAACGLSHDATQLIAARVVQGVGGAMLAPQSLTILTATFPAERRGAALGIWGSVVGLSTVAGPTLGGLIVTYLDWPWIFFLNLPVGVVAFAATLAIVPDIRPGQAHTFDIRGTLLASAGLLLVVFGLIEGQKYSWGGITGSPFTIPEVIIAGVALLVAFIVFEAFQKEPLLPLGLFRDRNFSLMNWTGAAMQYGMQGIFIPITIYTQSVLGMTALQSGLTVAPMSLAAAVVAPFAGRLSDRFGGKYLLLAGLAIFGLGAGSAAYIAQLDSTSWTFVVPLIVTGLGLGFVFAPMTTIAMHNIRRAQAASASGVLNTTRQLGSVAGAAVVGAVLQNRLAVAFHDQAVAYSRELPAKFQAAFVNGFDNAAKGGFQLGQGQSGAAPPAGLPPEAATTLQRLAHEVFTHGFLIAYKPTVYFAVAVLLVAALSCLFVANGRHRATAVEAGESAPATVPVGQAS